MKQMLALGCALALLVLPPPAQAAPGGATITVNGYSAGPTPFIAMVDLTVSPPDAIKAIGFEVAPKPFSVTRPVAASYSARYLQQHGYLNTLTGHVTVPVFGLYENFDNTVVLNCDLAQGRSQRETLTVSADPWIDPTGGYYSGMGVVQPRSASTTLSYDFIMLKGFAAAISPIIIDTDGEVRWVGTAGAGSISGIFYDNGIYISGGSAVTRMELDGTFRSVGDYAGLGVTSTGHHNYDAGKDGILVEVDTTAGVESTVMEISATGAVLRMWKLADIISAAMIADGDDPSAFVRAADDWFHNNSTTYWSRTDTLVVSGREDFVIGLDYESGAIKWILGDQTKAWYQYPSLRKYALTVEAGGVPPIGQHALSITRDGELMLFDNGRASLNHTPPGMDRGYSAPRKYQINTRKMTATETWHYLNVPSLNSQYCSSVYEDARNNYLMDYTLTGDLMGFDGRGDKTFHYQLSTAAFCAASWNAIPIHLENVMYQ